MSPGPYLNSGVFRTAVSANTAEQQEEVGVWRFESGNIYRYMRAGALIPAYEAVSYDNSVVSGSPLLLGNQVIAAIGETNLVLGIAETTLSSGNYGWITVYGPVTARVQTTVIPGRQLGAAGETGVLGIRTTSNYHQSALAVQTGLSAGSAVFLRAL